MKINFIAYIIIGLGAIGLFITSGKIKPLIPIISNIPTKYILLPSLAIIGIALIILMSTKEGSSSKEKSIKEVPIYHKDKIVAYRRHY